MASLWSGVKLQDVKTQLALRGHQVPDDIIISFLRDAATSSYELPSSAACVGATEEDGETDTASSDSSSEQAQEETALPLEHLSKGVSEEAVQPQSVSAGSTAAGHADIASEAASVEASPGLRKEEAELHVRVPLLASARAGSGIPGQHNKTVGRRDAEVHTLKLRQQLASVAISGGPRVLSPLNTQNLRRLDSESEGMRLQKEPPSQWQRTTAPPSSTRRSAHARHGKDDVCQPDCGDLKEGLVPPSERRASKPASSRDARHTARDVDIPILNASYLVPARPSFHRVDRVARFRELQEEWSRSSFLKSGGDHSISRRKKEDFANQFAELHAHEQEQHRTCAHDRVLRQADLGATSNVYIIPSAKRRDTLRWETRLRMQLRDENCCGGWQER
ncbi:hypothetical protein WJX84_007607 [Apatococcus fuscideae]|uniref:Centriolar and ciliogenesis-associated protein HYLS1 C-terminal domain-containing protein n=1 Tax=Apatococcus fuscideae TaxID=2026836 RepID=A0AAW1SRT8_9CHLO